MWITCCRLCITLGFRLFFHLNAAVCRMDPHIASLRIVDFSYPLPSERIAHFPLEQRDASKLLVYEGGRLTDSQFQALPSHLPEETTLVLNDTRVIEARIIFQKETGGRIELFCLEPDGAPLEQALQQQGSARWRCLIGGASKWKPGQVLEKTLAFPEGPVQLTARYEGREGEAFLIHFSWEGAPLPFVEILHRAGAMPLPPYIKRVAAIEDADRYQTVFSRHDGSVAAPTAALHFTPAIFEVLAQKGIRPQYLTLHVGAGTFKPVKTEWVAEHAMHGEPFVVSRSFLEALLSAKKIVAVGTTSLRSLESLYWLGLKLKGEAIPELGQWEAYALAERHGHPPFSESLENLIKWMEQRALEELHCRTSLLIMPGYRFHLPQGLITNFHQPQSTLLLLIAAFVGEDWKKIYAHALENDYRFLSYGDSSLLWRADGLE
jgi:S-adenosylmethionine:tRNA ribosyltransferase-isomerase